MKKRQKKEHNPRASGRYPMFKSKYGVSKRISVTIPDKKETEIKKEIDVILEPYKNI